MPKVTGVTVSIFSPRLPDADYIAVVVLVYRACFNVDDYTVDLFQSFIYALMRDINHSDRSSKEEFSRKLRNRFSILPAMNCVIILGAIIWYHICRATPHLVFEFVKIRL
jgi:hypothetical protein